MFIKYGLYGICLWNDNYLFVGCEEIIKLVDLKTGEILENYLGHNEPVITIKKINLPKYGECLISGGQLDDKIKIWGKHI